MSGGCRLLLRGVGACGPSTDESPDEPAARTPAPAPRVVLTADDRQVWAPAPPERAVVPVLLYHGVAPASGFSQRADADLGIDPEDFARQMALLDHAGYDTITLDEFVRFIEREQVSLPPRPLLLSFDGARLDSWTGSDGTLRKRGFNAVLFVDVGRVEEDEPEYLTWRELNSLQRSGRWEVQLQSGSGHHQIQYGPAPDDVGPFYAYRGSEEILGGWRERVFSDITWGEEQLAFRVRRYRPLAFAPPYGNYGQAGTNDQRIPRELLAGCCKASKSSSPRTAAACVPGGDQPARSNRDQPRHDRRRASRAAPGPAALRERLLPMEAALPPLGTALAPSRALESARRQCTPA